ncbi:TOMM precursor leader peptide-binding protein [Nonomuraea sp. PA05]|uniref:TOMM precursor leader peptide-binding protein n=1 Tax=Nonomuraea sp. PA05 TaxID=2604466 RepID=UPI0011D30D74|nr:TOMM precursor leader peptide-binding protein [Nonomuraea sp. PA05]TYB45785.1 TOMM precursor leader peptide-binding protein [Nonomuraea sp. PA05]
MAEATIAPVPSATDPGRVTVLGEGRLHAAIRTALTPSPRPAGGAIVIVSDADDMRPYPAVARRAAEQNVPWLPVRVEAGWALVGPAVHPSRPGCPTCVARRRAGNRPDAQARAALRAKWASHLDSHPTTLLTPLVSRTVAALVADEVHRLHQDPAAARTTGALLKIRLPTAAIRRHTFLPDPLCPDCGSRPDDGPHAGLYAPGPAPKPDPKTFRVGGITGRGAELERRFVDAETGIVQALVAQERGGGPMAIARLSPARTEHESHHGYGRSDDFASARATAVAEALERIAGIHPRSRRTTVRAAYADIADDALDPRTLGLYPDDWYDRPGFLFTRFDPERPTTWVWAYSFGRDAPLLVPESYAFFGPRPPHDPGFAYECSNGCALGGHPAEAILYGLLEVAERDAALATWYARLPVPRVDLGSAADRRIPMLAQRVRDRLGYDVHAFAALLEQRVPVFWVMAVDAAGRPDRPRALCGSASHPDSERALRRALEDLGPMLAGHLERYDPAASARLVADSEQVRLLEDHPLTYAHPDAFGRLGFLPLEGPALTVAEVAAQASWPRHDDLRADVAELAARYLASGLDVIAVDSTSPEARACGMHAAKVIVPGTLSMTFGHRYRRVHGLPRLPGLPRLLGHRDRDLRPDELNPYPHPFP